jgi:DNA polymerase III epsilon subunit
MRSVVLDTETTGMPVTDGHRIIEIGCVEVIGRRLTGRHYHVYLQPDREVDEGAIAVHGITNEFLVDKPRFRDIADEFFEFIKDAQLVILSSKSEWLGIAANLRRCLTTARFNALFLCCGRFYPVGGSFAESAHVQRPEIPHPHRSP